MAAQDTGNIRQYLDIILGEVYDVLKGPFQHKHDTLE